jgi:phospholipid-binding lipoprotein MlaA
MLLTAIRGSICLLGACLVLHSAPVLAGGGDPFTPAGSVAFALVAPGGCLGSEIRPEQEPIPQVSVPASPGEEPDPLELEPDPLFDEDFEELAGPEVYDPLERGNRMVFGFNQQVDRFVLDPVASGYRFAMPGPARRSVVRALINLNTPIYLVNNLLQVRLRDAAETLGAFVVNTTVGVGGLFDAGQYVGLYTQPADFGQTLALAGIGNGPYLVIPVMGPSTLRDGVGVVVDRFFHPLTYLLGIAPHLIWGGGVGISRRAEAAAKLEALEESSLDFYSVLRSAYVQTRTHSIEEIREPDEGELAASEAPSEEIAALEQ